ncbi:BadF/BadG/BcrA/BcrD ATPase family protein [Rossellomorea aquimaris]|uniref:BadF/BadG/BcrA/BcrD ATPase family protein n=1 Tax=Rossellomorea aquimaris TaxID=189382 RepID=UPI0005CA94FE|nr:BadF/BadG/BcrA/BcrD ATPase family protein [Rossellomorea aquimaris]
MTRVIGIDAGGTKIQGLVLDSEKNILFQSLSGHGNPTVSFDEALTNLSSVIQQCLEHTSSDEVSHIVIGMAGAESGNLAHRIRMELQRMTSLPIIVLNDATLAYFSLIGNQDGVMTIAGTGSICYGRNGKQEGTTGGWGHLLGDEGSAYHIAIEACKQASMEMDSGKPPSPLSLDILNEIGASDGKGLKGFIYSSVKGEIAKLAKVVHKQAEAGNESALLLFKNAGEQLARQTTTLMEKLQITAKPVIALKGSVLEHNVVVQSTFKEGVSERFPDASYIIDSTSPATGAVDVTKAIREGRLSYE